MANLRLLEGDNSGVHFLVCWSAIPHISRPVCHESRLCSAAVEVGCPYPTRDADLMD